MERAEGPQHTDHRNARSLRKENKVEQRLERERREELVDREWIPGKR